MISIIVPVYNASLYLEECLVSICRQAITDWECILINDGSTDNSGEICNHWTNQDSRFKVYHKKNQGVSIARNLGIELAKGDYIYFIDADDWCLPGLFEFIDGSDIILGLYNNWTHKVCKSANLALDWLKSNLAGRIGSFLVKRDILQDNSIKFKSGCKYGEDLAFICRCLLYSKSAKIVSHKFMEYRDTPGSAINTATLRRYDVIDALWDVVHEITDNQYQEVRTYLLEVSMPESFVIVTRDLLRGGVVAKDIVQYITENHNLQVVPQKAIKSSLTPKQCRYECSMILRSLFLYKIYIIIIYKWYDFVSFLGKTKYRLFQRL